jgi:hypothetical protein
MLSDGLQMFLQHVDDGAMSRLLRKDQGSLELHMITTTSSSVGLKKDMESIHTSIRSSTFECGHTVDQGSWSIHMRSFVQQINDYGSEAALSSKLKRGCAPYLAGGALISAPDP